MPKNHEPSDIFAALASPQRLAITQFLSCNPNGVFASQIASALDMPKNLLSFHAHILEESQVISIRKDGRNRIYSLNLAVMEQIVRYVMGNYFSAHELQFRTSRKANIA